jgi:hypothetical protein
VAQLIMRAPALLLALLVPAVARAGVDQPEAIIDRPRTLPAGELEALASLSYMRLSPDPLVDDTTALGLGAGYGLTRDLDARITYPLQLRPPVDGDTRVLADVGFTFLRGDLSAAAHVRWGVQISGLAAPLELGANLYWRVAPRVSLFTGNHWLAFAMAEDPKVITLSLPVGAAVQLGPQVYVQLTTTLGRLGLYHATSAVVVRDATPLAARAFFSLSAAADLYVDAALADLRHPRDGFTFGAGARLFF